MKFKSFVVAAALLLVGCRAGDEGNRTSVNQAEAAVAPILTTPDARDNASYARPLEARVTHVALDLGVDFNARRIGGTATLDIQRKPGAREIILDDKGLEIESVTDGNRQPLEWKVGDADEKLGAPLAITLRPDTERLSPYYDVRLTRHFDLQLHDYATHAEVPLDAPGHRPVPAQPRSTSSHCARNGI